MKATVIVTSYNHEKYISQAIASVLMQTYNGDYEIILCDDSSTDRTLAIAEHILNNVPNHYIIANQTNLGITKNYQQAFSRCRGEFVFIIEGDDYWTSPLKMQKQTDFLERHGDTSMCAHLFYKLTAGDVKPETPVLSSDAYSIFSAEDLITDPGLISNFSTCCYRRSTLENIPIEAYSVTSYDWMINICSAIQAPLGRVNQCLSVYRVHADGSWSRKNKLQQLKDLHSIIPEYDRVLKYQFNRTFTAKREKLAADIALLEAHPIESGSYRLSMLARLKNRIRKFFASI